MWSLHIHTMVSYIAITLILLYFLPPVHLKITENFTETHPVLNLKSSRLFAKNRTVAQNQTHFRLPRVFDQLEFECSSTLPTKWNYYNLQVKKVDINKWRQHSITGNGTMDTFYSTFKVELSNPNIMINLSCENICPKELGTKCRYLNSYLKYTETGRTSPGYFNLQYSLGNKFERYELQNFHRVNDGTDTRLGWNMDCKYLLHVDLQAGTFACTLADGSEEEVPSFFVPCTNPDECTTVFKNSGDNCTHTVTFKRNCTSDICSELRDTSTLFVLACGDYNEDSVARGFFKTLQGVQEGKKELHAYNKKTVPFNDMVQISMTSTVTESPEMRFAKKMEVIYTKYKREFVCTAVRSFFSYGFRWILRFINGSEVDLGVGKEYTHRVTQLYIAKKFIAFTSPLITSVTCEAPNWNELHGTNSTMNVTVKECMPPYFIEYNGKKATQVKAIVINLTAKDVSHTLNCSRSGHPPAVIRWRFDGIKPELSNSTDTAVLQHYTMHEESDAQSVVVLNANHPFGDVVCVASNAAGDAKVHFRFKGENVPVGHSIDVPIIIGVLAFALAVVVIVILSALRKVRKAQVGAYLSEGEIQEFFTGTSAGHDAFVRPYDEKLEVSSESFTTEDIVLGSGTYGRVLKGHIGFLDVAIKVSRSGSESLVYLKSLLSEVKIMSYVGNHPNIVNLIGVCTSNLQKNEVQVILEFCERGDLHSLLKKGRDRFINLFDTSLVDESQKNPVVSELLTSNMILSTKHLVCWALDIVEGLEFVSSKNIIHGDLAARNVLITHDLKAKISDFGLSKQMYSDTVYVKTSMVPMPTRWMAYESLKNLEFTTQSDIWSLGVTLWEMFTLGDIPYEKYLWEFQSYSLLAEGIRLEKPLYASGEIYDLMFQTWNLDPAERPSFSGLKESLNAVLENLQD